MIPTITREMDPRIRQRYHFAASAFSRMHGVDKVTLEMHDFCRRWAETHLPTPLEGLNEVDRYFRNLWDTSRIIF